MSRTIAALAVATFSALALTACDPLPSTFDRIGVTSGEDASVQILYLGCDDERIAAVALIDGNDPNRGDDNELLWEIRSENGAEGGVFTVGTRPEGFVETVAFEGELSENLVAAVEIEDAIGPAIDFAPTDLQPGMVFSGGDSTSNVPAGAFEQQALESCQRP